MKNPRPRSDTWRLHGFGGGPRTTVFPYIQGIRPSPGLPGGCFPAYHPPMSDLWMTYAEAGERLGIKPESVKRRARLKVWPKRIGNDGLARVQVPGMIDPPGHPADSPPDESPPKSAPNSPLMTRGRGWRLRKRRSGCCGSELKTSQRSGTGC